MIDVTKTVREITYNGTIIPLLGSGDNPIKVSTDAEMESYLRDDKYLGVYIKFIGDSSSKYLKDQVYCVAKEGVNSKFYLLESLTNPASSAEVLEGFECYDDEGKKLVGKRESENNKIRPLIERNITSLNFDNYKDVEVIGPSAFRNCYNLQNVNFSSSIREIGNEAFQNCTTLRDIHIPNTVKTMGNNVFDGCTSLLNVMLSNATDTIGNFTFNLAGMRQSIAVAILLAGLVLYDKIERVLPKYIVIASSIYLAFSFHYTAGVCVLILPLLWFSRRTFPIDNKLAKIFLMVLPIVIMVSTKYVANVVNYFMITKYEHYETSFGDSNVVSYIIIPYCMYLYTLFLFYRSNSSDWKTNFCFYCSIVHMCVAACTLYIPMLARFEYYFSMPLMCLIANLTMELPLSKRKIFVFAISLVCMAFFLISTPGGTLKIDNYSFF